MDGVERLCTAFEGDRRIASGALARVAVEVKRVMDRGESAPVLIFDDETSEQIEVDLRGTADDVARRFERPADAVERGAARSGASPARGRGARGDAFAASLGMARRPARRRVGDAPQARRRGPPRQRGQGPNPQGARSGLSIPVDDGREPAGLRGSQSRLFAGDSADSTRKSPPGPPTSARTPRRSPAPRFSRRGVDRPCLCRSRRALGGRSDDLLGLGVPADGGPSAVGVDGHPAGDRGAEAQLQRAGRLAPTPDAVEEVLHMKTGKVFVAAGRGLRVAALRARRSPRRCRSGRG